MHRTPSLLGLSACAFFSFAAALHAQVTSAHLGGSVVDTTGAAVAHARIKATNTATDFTQNVTADGSGGYALPPLPPGPYSLTVDAPGFQQSIDTGIVLTVGQAATLNITLKVGAATESTTVNASAEIINTTTAELSQVIDEHSVKELPLNGRDPSSLVFLSAGVTNELISQASTLPSSNSFPLESGASAGERRFRRRRSPGQHLVPARRRLQYGYLRPARRAVSQCRRYAGVPRHHR